jgi:hypothetical protein
MAWAARVVAGAMAWAAISGVTAIVAIVALLCLAKETVDGRRWKERKKRSFRRFSVAGNLKNTKN